MYVRFVVDEIDEDSGVEQGIFQAMYRLSRAGKLNAAEEAWWADVRTWFNLELEKPKRLARSRRTGANQVAISWFKESAAEHVRRRNPLGLSIIDGAVERAHAADAPRRPPLAAPLRSVGAIRQVTRKERHAASQVSH